VHLIGKYETANVNQAITFLPDGSLYALGTTAFVQLDPATGAKIGTPIALTGDFRGLAPVPEPSTFALLTLGILGLLVCVWRRRK
jgi:hypothetical protein